MNDIANTPKPVSIDTALVLGATGLVGSHLVSQLSENTQVKSVRAITRRPVVYESSKVINEIIDFEALENHRSAFLGNVLFSCLGTTKKQAGSIAEQRRVDFDHQYQAARLAVEQGVRHYVLVSSSGANPDSLNPYLRMKGELERAVTELGFASVSIVQPSLLLGDRSSRNDRRLAEEIGSVVLPVLCKLPILNKYRPIKASDVAARMIELALTQPEGKKVVTLDAVFPTSEH